MNTEKHNKYISEVISVMGSLEAIVKRNGTVRMREFSEIVNDTIAYYVVINKQQNKFVKPYLFINLSIIYYLSI